LGAQSHHPRADKTGALPGKFGGRDAGLDSEKKIQCPPTGGGGGAKKQRCGRDRMGRLDRSKVGQSIKRKEKNRKGS